jgi:hypothetical protein
LPLVIGGHRWLRLLLLGTALYLVLLPIWWYALDGLAAMAAVCADWIYHFFEPRMSINADGKLVKVVVRAGEQSGFAGQSHTSALRMDTVTYGLPMLVALIVVTRADSLSAKLRGLVTGTLLMTLLTVPAVILWAKTTSLQLDEKIAFATARGGGDRSSFFYYAFHGYAFSQPVVAVAIWIGLIMLGLFKDKPPAPEAATAASRNITVSRNAACPCGSGRKYKRCCGSA